MGCGLGRERCCPHVQGPLEAEVLDEQVLAALVGEEAAVQPLL